jgi:abequosyltransferase
LEQFNKNLLSFCIPTYNRCDILRECLTDLISKIEGYNFDILISDNCSDDGTEALVRSFQARYANIKYFKQAVKLDVDVNFSFILGKSESKYTWLLGDSYRIEDIYLKEIIPICNSMLYPLIVVNSFDMIKGIATRSYDSLSDVLKDLGWYLPFMSAYLYRQDLLEDANFEKFYCSNFVQMGIIFDYFENKRFKILWFSKNSITSTNLKKQSWHNEFLKVFAKNWTEFILALPLKIPLIVKLQCIKDHGRYHQLFSFKNLISFREQGWLNYSACKDYKIYFPYIAIYPWPVVVLISILPISLLTRIKKLLLQQDRH